MTFSLAYLFLLHLLAGVGTAVVVIVLAFLALLALIAYEDRQMSRGARA